MEITAFIHSTLREFKARAKALEAEGKALADECLAANRLEQRPMAMEDILWDRANRSVSSGALDQAGNAARSVSIVPGDAFACLLSATVCLDASWPTDRDKWAFICLSIPPSDTVSSLELLSAIRFDLSRVMPMMIDTRDRVSDALAGGMYDVDQIMRTTALELVGRTIRYQTGVNQFVHEVYASLLSVFDEYTKFICMCSGLIPELVDEVMGWMLGHTIIGVMRKEHPLHVRRE